MDKKISKKRKSKQKKSHGFEQTTPKEFLRIMNMEHKKSSESLPGDEKPKKKSKSKSSSNSDSNSTLNGESNSNSEPVLDTQSLKIKPGESMADFSRRVDEAIPIGRAKTGTVPYKVLKKQKRIARQLAIEKEARIKKNGYDSDDNYENNESDDDQSTSKNGKKRKKSSSKREKSPDPWASIAAKHPPLPKFGEVAQEPPKLQMPVKTKINVPKSSGSLARRHSLESERERIINSYRALMLSKQK